MDSTEKGFGILAYFNLLVLVPILAGKTEFSKFHANQGLVLCIIEIVFGAAIGILARIPILGVIFGIVGGLFELVCLIMAIIGIVHAVNGEMKELPVIGGIRLIK